MATVQELEQMLREARESEAEQDRTKRDAQMEAWKVLVADPDNWEWDVKPQVYHDWPDEEPLKGLYIAKRVKQEPLAAWTAKGPSTFHSDAQTGNWAGMFYYRTDENILTHSGGGTHILSTPKLCSDAEWAEIATGRIPEKFLRRSK